MADDDVDRLYALPLSEFTKERNALAARLRKDGERELAEEVRALAKPTVIAWAVNQLARRNEVQVRGLLRAGERLREAQEKALAGKGADALRDATREERDVVQRLVAEARKVLPRPSQQQLDRLAETLRAGAVDDQARELLKRGRLTSELEGTGGFDVLAGMPVATPKKRPSQAKPKRTADEERAERKRAVAEARERLTAARAEARERDRAASQAEREAAKLRAAAEDAAAAVEAAEAALRSLQ